MSHENAAACVEFMEHFKPILTELINKKVLTPEKSWQQTEKVIHDYFCVKELK